MEASRLALTKSIYYIIKKAENITKSLWQLWATIPNIIKYNGVCAFRFATHFRLWTKQIWLRYIKGLQALYSS